MNSNSIIGSTFKVGRVKNNNVELPYQGISAYHADLICLSENAFLIEDKNSTNGTFVNGYKIKRIVCSRNDEVQFANYLFDLNTFFPAESLKKDIHQQMMGAEPAHVQQPVVKQNPNDYTQEFAELELVYKFYNERKLLLQKAQHNKRLMQAAPSAVLVTALLAGSIVFPVLGMGAIAAGSIGGLVGIALSNSTSEQEKMAAIEEEFKFQYACPKCKNFFGYLPWRNLAHKKSCERCKAIWVQ